MSYLNAKNPTVSRYIESNNDKSPTRPSSPQQTVRSRNSSTFIPDNRSISSTKSVKSYPRKGTTLAGANLTAEERKHLEEVLIRFDQFRQIEDSRVKRLRQEMIDKQKVRIKKSETTSEGHCNNCNALFVPLLQPAIRCVNCHGDFCRICTEKLPNTKIVMCKFCRFETLHKCKLGVWFTEQLKQARACGRVRGVSGPEALRSSMLRIQREAKSNNTSRSQGASMQELNSNDDSNAEGNYHEVNDQTDSEDEETNSNLSQSSLKKEDRTLTESSDVHPSEKHSQEFSCSSVQQYPEGTSTDENVNDRTDIGNNDDSRSVSLIHPKNEANESTIVKSVNIQRCNGEGGPVAEQFGANHQVQRGRYKKSKSLHNSQSLVDSGYVPQRTHSWTGDEIDPTIQKHHSSTPQLNKTSSSKEVDLHKQNAGFSSSECYSTSLTSETTSVAEKKLTPPCNELVPTRIITTQQKRLDSEVGSNLSIASGVYPNSVQTLTNFDSVKVLNVQDRRRRRSSSLNEIDFVYLSDIYHSTPLSKIDEKNFNESHTKCLNPAPSFRSLFQIRLDRNNASQGSSLSICSERESSYTHGIQISGELLMSIIYDGTYNALRVGIKQARDLAIADRKRNVTNPYVKCYLLPDRTKGSKRKTSHKKSTCNPVFDEEFKYYILKQDLTSRTLQVTVWHYNVLGSNLFLGEIFLPLTFHQFDETSHWYTLGEHRLVPAASHLQINRGEIVLALKLVPGEIGSNRGEIHVWIKSAKGLSASTDGVASQRDNVDPYVKIYMLPGKEKHSKQKTKVVRKNNNPEWNQAIIYRDIILSSLNQIGIEVSIWDHDRFSSNDFLGGCRLNCGSQNQPWMDATNAEKSAWLAMCERPNIWIEATIQLRPNLY